MGISIVTSPTCQNGAWVCPGGSVHPDSCGGCFGLMPPGYVCGDGGWTLVDASSQ